MSSNRTPYDEGDMSEELMIVVVVAVTSVVAGMMALIGLLMKYDR